MDGGVLLGIAAIGPLEKLFLERKKGRIKEQRW
jgi:hypothetical protein